MCKQCPETTRQRLSCQKVGTSQDVEGFAIGHFWSDCCWKSKIMMTSVRTMSKMLVWSAQNRCLAKFTLKITTKSAIFYRLLFGKVCPENSHEISQFFREFICKNPAKFDFFFRDLSEALNTSYGHYHSFLVIVRVLRCFYTQCKNRFYRPVLSASEANPQYM